MDKVKLTELHQLITECTKKIDFYNDELKVFKHRLEEVAVKNTKTETLSLVESYQNRIIAQEHWLYDFENQLKEINKSLVQNVANNPVAFDHRYMEVNNIKAQFNREEELYHDLKSDFNGFLQKVM